ncbi:MAG TPA: NAD(P)/FAD-dependent oxidoreductase, partial [Acidobacteriota bacterium]|nr:NAD(P)/FAD-dependent oxidoreductase [Acidobacteriota bacterium]
KDAPLSDAAKKDLFRLYKQTEDYMPGLNSTEKKAKLARMSYADFLTGPAKCDPAVLPFLQTRPHPLYGVGIDAVPAQDAWGLGLPGFDGMKLDPKPGVGMNRDSIPNEEAEKYFFHFPDGNASIARMLVRKLIPAAIPGKNAEDIVLARARYNQLDKADSPARIRLSSTVVRVKPADNSVEVSYVRDGKLATLRGSKCVLACWHTVIPYICPDLPRDQQTALAFAVKVPIVYARAAIRNWTSWVKMGVQKVEAPGHYFFSQSLSMPLSIGGYDTAATPEEPVVVALERTPCSPGLPARQQHRVGRAELLATNFETFERHIREEMAAIFGPGGFDPARDITGIAVHRWPHGYAYQYNSLFDPFWLDGEEGPCAVARKPFGRITIANSDAEAYAYTDSAINEGYRAVQELLGT